MSSKKRKVREILSSDENSGAETIQYAEPYGDISEKDEIYRRTAKKKAIKILTNKKRKLNTEDEQDNVSDSKIIPYAEPYRNTFTKKDEIYRTKAKKKAIKMLTKKNPSTKKNKNNKGCRAKRR